MSGHRPSSTAIGAAILPRDRHAEEQRERAMARGLRQICAALSP
ncbi:hypothetical protein [Solimonas sp. SE-A11]|nr:hypothetical protein [Solimonas sp. SE-A11]MDM4768988.1 hypothetical protein [Solimonas sp. SE-A11]